MAKADGYDELIFQLGDLARDRLAGKANCPRTMDRVYRAEEGMVARREELEAIEREMNELDAEHQHFQEQQAAERPRHEAGVKRQKRAVDAIEGRVKELRKKLVARRSDLKYAHKALSTLEAHHHDLEMTAHDDRKIAVSRENLKKNRLQKMRVERDIEDLAFDLKQVLTPAPGHPGAEAILAHARLLEMEDEAAERKADLDEKLAALDKAVAAKELELQAAEDYLDQALFLLGEDVYRQRIADAALAALYPRLDRAAR